MPAFLLSPIARNLIAGAVAFLMGCAFAVWATSIYYKADIADLNAAISEKKAADATASLDQFKSAVDLINVSALNYSNSSLNLNLKMDRIARDLQDVKNKKPLPVDCKPDFERLQSFAASVAAANAAAAGQ